MAPTRRIIINVLQGVTVLSNLNLPDKVFNDDDFTFINLYLIDYKYLYI